MSAEPRVFVKKPCEVEAMRWMGPKGSFGGATENELIAWGAEIRHSEFWGLTPQEGVLHRTRWSLEVKTLHGWALVRYGDWIVKGPADFWPVDQVVFRDSYQLKEKTDAPA